MSRMSILSWESLTRNDTVWRVHKQLGTWNESTPSDWCQTPWSAGEYPDHLASAPEIFDRIHLLSWNKWNQWNQWKTLMRLPLTLSGSGVCHGSNLMISACISIIMINLDMHFASSSFHCSRHLHIELWVHLKMPNPNMLKTINVAQKPLTTTFSFLKSAHAELP